MAMTPGQGLDADDNTAVMGAINTTPRVDVLRVLPIIFPITIPVLTTSVIVNLPKEPNWVCESKAENVIVSNNHWTN